MLFRDTPKLENNLWSLLSMSTCDAGFVAFCDIVLLYPLLFVLLVMQIALFLVKVVDALVVF